MPLGFLLKAVQGCDYDSDELYKSPEHAAFIKNICLDLNENSSIPDGQEGTEGDNAGVFTPIESTEQLCPFPLPEGVNYCIGYHESKETNEGYVFVWNSNKNHLVYVIDGYTSRCQKVWQTPCLAFILLPQHFISLGRCVLHVESYFNKATSTEETRKFLVFTDDTPPIKFVSVTDAIATNGFTLPFFAKGNCAPCDLLTLAIKSPASCINITPVTRTTADQGRPNLINRKVWQFRIKWYDVWYRNSEHGIISDAWYSSVGKCVLEGPAQPRCLDLSFDAGCATVAKIQIEYRIWNANDPDLSVPTGWFLYDTLDKYDQTNPTLQWWERAINPDLRYDAATNKISYTFCGDKGTSALPVDETKRNFNPIALSASSVFSANKSIGTAGHRRGFPPLNSSLLDKIKYTVEKPVGTAACEPKTRDITVYAQIRTIRPGGTPGIDSSNYPIQLLKTSNNRTVYGESYRYEILVSAKQQLPENVTGFIGYFVGSTEWVYSKQVRIDVRDKTVVEIGLGDPWIGLNRPSGTSARKVFDRNFVILQRFIFKDTQEGRRIFRIAAADTLPSLDYQRTSTPIFGTAVIQQDALLIYKDKFELVINQCEGNVDMKDETLWIADISHNTQFETLLGATSTQSVVKGYLYEDEISKVPLEMALVLPKRIAGGAALTYILGPNRTDHNGFYWGVSDGGYWILNFFATVNCQVDPNFPVAKTETAIPIPGFWLLEKNYYAYPGTLVYPDRDRMKLKGRVTLCSEPMVGVAGVLVMLTNGGWAVSDENGYYTIVAHDKIAGAATAFAVITEQPHLGTRVENIMFASRGGCAVGRCDNPCSVCFDNVVFTTVPCGPVERVFNVLELPVSMPNTGLRGPQNGGRYELGIVPYYAIDQPGAVQRTKVHVVDIPTIGETGVYAFSTINYELDPSIRFPATVKYFTFAITRNLNWDNFLTWVAEKVEYVDLTGNVNNVAPAQVKFYYSGMIEYNIQNGLAANSVWQFLDEKEAPILGDQVEIIANGNGSLFTKRVSALVKFDKDGFYFLVNYTEDLKGITDGAQIKLIRPHVGTNLTWYYEQCRVIKVTDGKVDPADLKGRLNYFDAYMVIRQIPVPYYYIDEITKLLKKDTLKSVLKTYSVPFEHHSPSDFWADHAANRGRVYTINPFENQQVRGSEISLSRAISNDGILNGLSYFDENFSTEFDEQEWGSITVVIPNIGSLTVICQQDNFEVPFDDNTVRMNKDGSLTAVPLSGRMGRPQRKRGNNYGCHVEDINTIRQYKGLIMFIDRSEAALVSLYGDAQDVSNNGFRGHLKDKIKHMLQYNQSGAGYIKYFHASFDPRRKQYLLTMFKVPVTNNPVQSLLDIDYVNQLRYKSVEAHETLGYDPFQKSLKLSYSTTPEYFGTLFGHKYDNQLLSFKNAVAYIHHKNANPADKSFLNFYGILCEGVYEPVLNIEPNAVKRFLWTEVLCRQQPFFIDQVITESGQRSRLLLSAWEKRENFYTADFKMNTLTYPDPNIPALLDGDKRILEGDALSGKWIRPRYIARPEGTGKYFEMDGVHIFIFVAQKSGTTPGGERIQTR